MLGEKIKITFTNTVDWDIEPPKPAEKCLPNWYKETPSYINDKKTPPSFMPEGSNTSSTIKRCMPVFDVITMGYIIDLPADVYVYTKINENGDKYQVFEWAALNLINFHATVQASKHPLANTHAYPKFNNPWAIKTPKGYSTLFVQPFHRKSVFTIFSGVVDTDVCSTPVNFPFVLNDVNFEGLIPKGTPIVQVIPFKRDSWKMSLGSVKEKIELKKISNKLDSKFFDKYKSLFWNKKSYK
jgi:hypothetical protein